MVGPAGPLILEMLRVIGAALAGEFAVEPASGVCCRDAPLDTGRADCFVAAAFAPVLDMLRGRPMACLPLAPRGGAAVTGPLTPAAFCRSLCARDFGGRFASRIQERRKRQGKGRLVGESGINFGGGKRCRLAALGRGPGEGLHCSPLRVRAASAAWACSKPFPARAAGMLAPDLGLSSPAGAPGAGSCFVVPWSLPLGVPSRSDLVPFSCLLRAQAFQSTNPETRASSALEPWGAGTRTHSCATASVPSA